MLYDSWMNNKEKGKKLVWNEKFEKINSIKLMW